MHPTLTSKLITSQYTSFSPIWQNLSPKHSCSSPSSSHIQFSHFFDFINLVSGPFAQEFFSFLQKDHSLQYISPQLHHPSIQQSFMLNSSRSNEMSHYLGLHSVIQRKSQKSGNSENLKSDHLSASNLKPRVSYFSIYNDIKQKLDLNSNDHLAPSENYANQRNLSENSSAFEHDIFNLKVGSSFTQTNFRDSTVSFLSIKKKKYSTKNKTKSFSIHENVGVSNPKKLFKNSTVNFSENSKNFNQDFDKKRKERKRSTFAITKGLLRSEEIIKHSEKSQQNENKKKSEDNRFNQRSLSEELKYPQINHFQCTQESINQKIDSKVFTFENKSANLAYNTEHTIQSLPLNNSEPIPTNFKSLYQNLIIDVVYKEKTFFQQKLLTKNNKNCQQTKHENEKNSNNVMTNSNHEDQINFNRKKDQNNKIKFHENNKNNSEIPSFILVAEIFLLKIDLLVIKLIAIDVLNSKKYIKFLFDSSPKSNPHLHLKRQNFRLSLQKISIEQVVLKMKQKFLNKSKLHNKMVKSLSSKINSRKLRISMTENQILESFPTSDDPKKLILRSNTFTDQYKQGQASASKSDFSQQNIQNFFEDQRLGLTLHVHDFFEFAD